jgi:hypothetical protein
VDDHRHRKRGESPHHQWLKERHPEGKRVSDINRRDTISKVRDLRSFGVCVFEDP